MPETLPAAPVSSSAVVDRHLLWPRRILVASGGSASSHAAIDAARTLAESSGGTVDMMAVFSPRIPVPTTIARRGLSACEGPEREMAVTLIRSIRQQRRNLGVSGKNWPLRLEVGDPVSVIVRTAHDVDADIVVVGIGCHEPAERRLGNRTAMRAALYVPVPLYAAASDCDPATTCVIALPNGPDDAATIRAALGCVRNGAHLWLALPAESAAISPSAVKKTAREILSDACSRGSIDAVDAMTVDRVDVAGDMLSGVLRLADDVHAQLIAAPIHGAAGPVRAFLPNLAEPLLMSARCSVLVVPDPPSHPAV